MVNINIDFQKKNGKLSCSDSNVFKLIREKFSIKNPSYKMKRIVPRLYSITPSGSFQVGLWNEISHYISSLNIPVNIEMTHAFKEQYQPDLNISNISTIDGYEYYDYQIDTLSEFVKGGRGISLISTGGGKTLIIAGMCKTLLDHYPDFKILLIVPNISLLNQLYYSFLDEFGIDNITRWGDSNVPDLTKNILLSTNSSLVSDVKKSLYIVQNYDVVIVDEVHTINEKKNQISKVVHNITTPFKFGLTGTLPDSLLANWNVIGKIGPIVYEKSSYELRKQNTITEIEIKSILCLHKDKTNAVHVRTADDNPTDAYLTEYDFIMNSSARNKVISHLVTNLKGNILITVDRRQYIDILQDCLKNSGKTIYVIHGDTPSEERTFIQNEMDRTENIVCIAMSKCFSTGVSVKNLHYAIFAYLGKGGVKTVQTIGRMVRKHPSKNRAIIFDIADNLKYSFDHFTKRLKIYKDQKIKYSVKKIKI